MDDSELRNLTDEQIMKKFKRENHWGFSIGIDLSQCHPNKINDPEILKDFLIGLCDYIKIKRYGDPTIVNFGSDPRVSGYSIVQLIETSCITGHFKDIDCSAFIDIFSCKEYPPHATANFCKKYFNAQKVNLRYITYRD